MPTGTSYRVPLYANTVNLPVGGLTQQKNGAFTPTNDTDEAYLVSIGAQPLVRQPVTDTVNRNLAMSDYGSTVNSSGVTYGVPCDLGVGFTCSVVGVASFVAISSSNGVTPVVNDLRTSGSTNSVASVMCTSWNVYNIYGTKP